jgi:uncharacterized protein YlxP (DUF503 family)
MIIGVCTLDFFLPGCSSLKQKRMFLRSIKEKLRNKHNVAVAEVEYLDVWQRARLGLTSVSSDQKILDSTFQAVLRMAEHSADAQLTNFEVEYL